jgi:hypothetical protein
VTFMVDMMCPPFLRLGATRAGVAVVGLVSEY